MKLQKLVFYSQALHLVRYHTILFPERIEAWVNGPVAPVLFEAHRGRYMVDSYTKGIDSHDGYLTPEERIVVDSVIRSLGPHTGEWLREKTHRESPWLDARGDCSDGDRCRAEISPRAILDYYSKVGEKALLNG
ncbi:Panacea domain-containing protein [Tractidigestivibacter sp.]